MKAPRTWVTMSTLLALPAAALISAHTAKADPVDSYTAWKATNICGYFAQSPRLSAVQPMFNAVKEDTGFSDADTARVLVTAVTETCPTYLPLLRVYAGLPAQGEQTAPAGIGELHRA